MDLPLKTGRCNLSYSFPEPKTESIAGLAKKITLDSLTLFRKDYGNILGLLKMPFTQYGKEGVHTLLQFYYPSLRCFVFPNYILLPTLEEYSLFLGVPIKNQVPYHCLMVAPTSVEIAKALYLSVSVVEANINKKGNCKGLHLDFLIQKAYEALASKEENTYMALLALCIYGIIMFPNVFHFLDLSVIHFFIMKNPVPTLLGDTYHSIHHKGTHKGGLVNCCAPLLYRWFRSHLPECGPFIDNRHTSKWAERMKGLLAKDIVWYNRGLEDFEIIMSCGKFDNVPLIGLRGGVNYNPVLARRTYGYAFEKPPGEKEFADSWFYHVATVENKLKEVVQAWKHICWNNKTHFGKTDCATYEDYMKW